MPRKEYSRKKKVIDPLFAKRLRQFREERDLTQEDVAKALDLSVYTISKYELGKAEPYMSTLKKLAEYYHVKPGYFIDDDYEDGDS